MNTMQQEFEQGVAQQYPYTIMPNTLNKSYTNNGIFICYTVDVVHKMWRAWQGSRENIKVELPKIRTLEYNANDNPYTNAVYLYSDDFYEVQGVKDALNKVGVKY